MAVVEYWLMVAFLGATAVGAFWFIWNRWRRARLIDDVPTAKIRSAAQGYTELHGNAVFDPKHATVSPLTATPCLWYRFKVERRGSDARGRRRWRTVHSGISDTPFLMEDETGLCLIDPRGAEVDSAHKRVWYGDTEWPIGGPRTQGQSGWLQRLVVERRYRYTEALLHAGNLYALGQFRSVIDTQQTLDVRVRELLHAWKTDQPALVARFDRNGDGQVDQDEWQQARQAAQTEALRRQLTHQSALPLHTLSAPEHRPFLLTDRSPAQLAQRYRQQAAASLTVFVAASLTVLWLLSQRA